MIFNGVEGLGKLLEIVDWHLRPLLRPQPDKHPRQHTMSQLKKFLDQQVPKVVQLFPLQYRRQKQEKARKY
jgi:hypothetical protein